MGEYRVKRGESVEDGGVRHFFPGRAADWSACGAITRSESREVTMLDGYPLCRECLPALVAIWGKEGQE